MPLAFDALTVAGVIVGFGLWLALIFAVHRWGPFEDEERKELRAALIARVRRLRVGSWP